MSFAFRSPPDCQALRNFSSEAIIDWMKLGALELLHGQKKVPKLDLGPWHFFVWWPGTKWTRILAYMLLEWIVSEEMRTQIIPKMELWTNIHEVNWWELKDQNSKFRSEVSSVDNHAYEGSESSFIAVVNEKCKRRCGHKLFQGCDTYLVEDQDLSISKVYNLEFPKML